MSPAELKALIRTVPDFPEPGIQFRDITTLIADAEGLRTSVSMLAEIARASGATLVAGMEARGFIFGAAVAVTAGMGFVAIRKPGKLPVKTIGVDYALEYGQDRLEMDPSAVSAGQKVIIVDDLLATGGTACATIDLLRLAGANVTHAAFLIDLPELGGSRRLTGRGVTIDALMAFDGA